MIIKIFVYIFVYIRWLCEDMIPLSFFIIFIILPPNVELLSSFEIKKYV